MPPVQLAPPGGPRPTPADVPSALRSAAGDLGQRPAVTVLRPGRRDEQGVASLAQWAAKGAHLLTLDLLLEPGDRLALRAPTGWGAAAVALAAWWAGLLVTLDGEADAAVVHEDHRAPASAADVLRLGDAVDGSPVGPVDGEPWAQAVQAFPDQPPEPRGHGDAPALDHAGTTRTQHELLAAVAADGPTGTLGLDGATVPPDEGLLAVALRPLIAGRPTVVLAGVDRDAANGERVAAWR